MIIEHLIYSELELNPLSGHLFIMYGLFHVIVQTVVRARHHYVYLADVKTEALKT